MKKWFSLLLLFSLVVSQEAWATGIESVEDSRKMDEFLGIEDSDALLRFAKDVRENSYNYTMNLCYGYREFAAKYLPVWYEAAGPINPLYWDNMLEGIFQEAMDPELVQSIFHWSEIAGDGAHLVWQSIWPGHLQEIFSEASNRPWYKELVLMGSLRVRYLKRSAGYRQAVEDCFAKMPSFWTKADIKRYSRYSPEVWKASFQDSISAVDYGVTGATTIASLFVGGFILKVGGKLLKPAAVAIRGSRFFRPTKYFMGAVAFLLADSLIYSIGEDQKEIEKIRSLKLGIETSLKKPKRDLAEETVLNSQVLVFTHGRLRALKQNMRHFLELEERLGDKAGLDAAQSRDDSVLEYQKGVTIFTAAANKFNVANASALFARISRQCGREYARGGIVSIEDLSLETQDAVTAACPNEADRYIDLATALYLYQTMESKERELKVKAEAEAAEQRRRNMPYAPYGNMRTGY